MIYLILAGLVLVIITVLNVIQADPMPRSMEDEDDHRSSKTVLVYREWQVSPVQSKAASDRHGDRG